MRANSPSSYAASISLHALLVVLIILFSLLVQRAQMAEKPPVIFDLVVGPPTDPWAKDAPAEGVPDPVQLNVPKSQVKQPPQPVIEEEPEVAPPVVKTPTPPKQTVTPKPEPKKKATVKETPPKMSYEEFKKKHGEPKVVKSTSPRPAPKVPRVDTKGITGGVKNGSSASTGGGGGKALTREELAAMDIYVAGLINRLKIAHDQLKPQGLGDTLSADVEFFVSANGEISNIRIVRSSGNAEFDASVREAFRRITWMGARPDKRSDLWRLTFRMREED